VTLGNRCAVWVTQVKLSDRQFKSFKIVLLYRTKGLVFILLQVVILSNETVVISN
jgi:hypothetical protein